MSSCGSNASTPQSLRRWRGSSNRRDYDDIFAGTREKEDEKRQFCVFALSPQAGRRSR
jgi:hypothetical protein